MTELQLGHVSKAHHLLETAHACMYSVEDPILLENLAVVHYAVGDVHAASSILVRALEVMDPVTYPRNFLPGPSYSLNSRHEVYVKLATLLTEAGDYAAARSF